MTTRDGLPCHHILLDARHGRAFFSEALTMEPAFNEHVLFLIDVAIYINLLRVVLETFA